MSKLLFEEETFKVIGACINVHKKLGNGFSESAYRKAVEIEFLNTNIPYEQEKKLPIYYDGELLDEFFIADFVCFDSVLLDIKSVPNIDAQMQQQVFNYLKSSPLEVGMLINFGEKSLKWKRFVHTISIEK
ncbi:GxxExxY protein [Lutibacter flavus]|uniref:GxxExxY protein n=1 Tax=Lutibacter flavus TaxID=691689 RepID=A0A238VU71_9FLAO|nr:GxxExxY protein [Lutibacter flavus]SNR37029.1 GxxExxY protein [Lutibacter flavus]